MSRSIFVFVLALVFVAAPSFAQKKNQPKKKDGANADGSIVLGDVGKELDEYMSSDQHFPGGFCGVALVSKGGTVLLEKGWGVMDAETKTPMPPDAMFDWCSVTKQFTAAALLKLEMQKKLSIADPLKKLFPKCPKDKADVTLKQLLNHTSGLKNDGGLDNSKLLDREATIEMILALPMASKPGETWAYNNIAYFLLGAIVEKVSGQTLEKFSNEQLFAPAGMDAHLIGDPKLDMARVPRDARGAGKQFAYGDRLTWGYKGAGGVVASTRDMLRWHDALMGDKLLGKAQKEELYTVGLQNYALGWKVSRDAGALEYSHTGRTGDVITVYLRWPDEKIVVAVAFSYDPKSDIVGQARELATIAKNAK
jgi:CubicO group peptidase (beta-lactamase class C family)